MSKPCDWRVRVYAGNKVIKHWDIFNRIECEATREAEADLQNMDTVLRCMGADDWTMTRKKGRK